MQLRLDELAKCLKTPTDTVERWIRQGRIPVRKKGDQCVYKIAALKKWADENNLSYVVSDTGFQDTPQKTCTNVYIYP